MTRISLNGKEQQVPDDALVTDLVTLLDAADRGCAVAINDEVVPRAQWSARRVCDGDRVEILVAVQGG